MPRLNVNLIWRSALYVFGGVLFGLSLRALERGDERAGFTMLVGGMACIGASQIVSNYVANSGRPSEMQSTSESSNRDGGWKLTRTADTVEIQIRPRRVEYFVVTSLIWVLFFFVAAMFVYGTIFHTAQAGSESTHLLTLLPLLFACLALFTWLSMSTEVIRVSGDNLLYSRRIFGLGTNKIFLLSDVKDLRVMPASRYSDPVERDRTHGLFTQVGLVGFEYRSKSYRIASGITEADAQSLLDEIARMLPGS